MKKKIEIELIPWAHRISSSVHGELIDYIKKLPKNSVMALETSEKFLREISKPNFLDNIEEWGALSLSAVELIMECKKRGIKIIPLESPIADTAGHRLIKKRGSFAYAEPLLLHQAARVLTIGIEDTILREKSFARQIATISKTCHQPKLFVVTGYGYTKGIKLELKKLGIDARINVSYTKQTSNLIESMNLYYRLKRAFEANNKEQVHLIAKKAAISMQKLSQKERNTKTLDEWIQYLIAQIREKKSIQEKRWKRKAEKAKKKMTQRRI